QDRGVTMGFRTKLVLSYIVLIALITGSFYLYFSHSLQKEMIEESRANLSSQTQLARLLVMSDKQVTSPQQLAESIGTVIKARVTLIAPDGTVIGDSDVGQARLAQLENHLQRPEVQEALKNGSGSALRYSDTLRTSMLYSAMTYGSGTTDGIIRLAMPLEYLASARSTLHGLVGGATVVTVLIALVNPAFRRLFSIAGDVEGKKLVEISRHPDLLEAFNDLGKPDVNELVRE